MNKRSQIPGSEVLFGKGKGKRTTKASHEDDATALQRRNVIVPTENTERMTLYMTPALWEAVEAAKAKLYREHGIKAKKSQIICTVLEKHIGETGEIAKVLAEMH